MARRLAPKKLPDLTGNQCAVMKIGLRLYCVNPAFFSSRTGPRIAMKRTAQRAVQEGAVKVTGFVVLYDVF